MFKIGKHYHRQTELHDVYGGNRQSGIAPCAKHPFVFLFETPKGKLYGYQDGWISKTEYQYTGQGKIGDMQMNSYNRAIRDHENDKRTLHLFDSNNTPQGFCEYIGEFQYVAHKRERRPDEEGQMRDAIVFRLRVIG